MAFGCTAGLDRSRSQGHRMRYSGECRTYDSIAIASIAAAAEYGVGDVGCLRNQRCKYLLQSASTVLYGSVVSCDAARDWIFAGILAGGSCDRDVCICAAGGYAAAQVADSLGGGGVCVCVGFDRHCGVSSTALPGWICYRIDEYCAAFDLAVGRKIGSAGTTRARAGACSGRIAYGDLDGPGGERACRHGVWLAGDLLGRGGIDVGIGGDDAICTAGGASRRQPSVSRVGPVDCGAGLDAADFAGSLA